jgi:drug/metabolite transporter (DMT)-like permease
VNRPSTGSGLAGEARAAAGRYAFAALILSNLFLAMGPWMVRLADVGPVASAFWRLSLAIPLLLLVARFASPGTFRPGRGVGLLIVIGGFFFAADLAAWHYGITLTKLANATLFGNTASLLFPIYGFIAARMLPRRLQAVAFLLAMAGAALLLGSSYSFSARQLRGDLFAILAGVFYTFYLIVIDRARQTLKPLPVLALATVAGAGPLLIFSLAVGERLLPSDWTPLILLALGSQVIGQGLLVYAVGHLSPLVIGLGLLTQPAVSALVGWLAYAERLSLTDAAGALLICVALVLIRLPQRLATDGPQAHLGGDRSA